MPIFVKICYKLLIPRILTYVKIPPSRSSTVKDPFLQLCYYTFVLVLTLVCYNFPSIGCINLFMGKSFSFDRCEKQ